MIGHSQTRSGNIESSTDDYVSGIIQSNSYLREQSRRTRTTVGGRSGFMSVLGGQSPVTGQSELVTVFTTLLRNGDIAYIALVVPQAEGQTYNDAFQLMLRSVRFND